MSEARRWLRRPAKRRSRRAESRRQATCGASWSSSQDVPAVNTEKIGIVGHGAPLRLGMRKEIGYEDATKLSRTPMISAGVIDDFGACTGSNHNHGVPRRGL